MKVLGLGVVALVASVVGAMSPPVSAQTDDRSLLGPVTWVSAGDSYSSGEGVAGNEGACSQTRQAYGPSAAQLFRERSIEVPIDPFAACTGHLVEDMFNPRSDADGGSSLWDWAVEQGATQRVDVITLSFGGNDIGFADLIVDCLVAPDSWVGYIVPVTNLTGCDTSEDDIRGRIDALVTPLRDDCVGGRDDSRKRDGEDYNCSLLLDDRTTPDPADDERGSLVDFYVKVASEHLTERGVLVVVNYPRIFAPAGEWPGWSSAMCAGVKRGDADRLGRLADHLNGRIENAVGGANRRLGAERVILTDQAAIFRDGRHELCGNGEDWLNGVSAFRGTDTVQLETSFHPNLAGHQGIAESVANQVEAGLVTNTTPFEPEWGDPYVISDIDLGDRLLTVARWEYTGNNLNSGSAGNARTVRFAPDLSVQQLTRNEVALESFASFLNSNPTPPIPERFSLTATDGQVAAISPFIDDGGSGEGYDFDYCWTAGYAEILLDGKIVSCPADGRPGVTLVQQDLNTLGYGPVAADGQLGPQTLAALARLRADHGYPDTGRADGDTLNLLKQKAVEQARQAQVRVVVPTLCGRDDQERPTFMFVNCTGNQRLTNISWSVWTPTSAVGTGEYLLGCGAPCGEDEPQPVPVTIELTDPRRWQCGDGPDYVYFNELRFQDVGASSGVQVWQVAEGYSC